jgi:urea transport system substrate-binding protein
MSSAGDSKAENCPPNEELAGFKAKTLDAEARDRVGNHLKTCKACQKKLTQNILSGIRESNRASDAALGTGGGTSPGETKPIGRGSSPSINPPSSGDGSKIRASSGSQTAPGSLGGDQPPEKYPYLDPPEEPGEIARLGMYNILRELGSGGMGVVFDAIDRRLSRRVALKVLKPELADESYVERFKQEARLAASLSDEHIVTIFEVGVSANVAFMAMEYLHGEPLDARLSRDGWLPIDEALGLLKQAAMGLATAHKAGLVHRDIKPANLWLERDKESGQFKRVKVLDFGLAKEVAKDSSLTAAGMVVGTPSYMAPEQVYGLPCDQRTDLFALGCVLYRMISGKLPFAGEDTMAVLQNTVDEPMPDMSDMGRKFPAKVLELLKRLLAKDPDDRPANAGVLIKQIDALSMGEILPTHSPTPSGNFTIKVTSKKEKRKTNWLAWASGALAFLAVTSSVALFFLKPAPKSETKESGTATGGSETKGGPANSIGTFTGEPIKVGVLFSRSGPFQVDEVPLADAVKHAVDEINAGTIDKNDKPGIDGRKVEIVRADGASNPTVYAAEAQRMIEKEGCRVIFGCWTSSCRKAVVEVLEKQAKQGRDCLLFYPMQFEGLEDSRQVVYLGLVPNQQVERSLSFARKEWLSEGPKRARRLYLVGSDYVYPRASFEVVRLFLETRFKGDFEIVGESFVPLKNPGLAEEAATKALAAKPDLILNALNGLRVNERFFNSLRKGGNDKGNGPGSAKVLSLSLTERDLEKSDDPGLFEGHYLVWSYLSSIAGPENQRFKEICKDHLSSATVPYDPLEAAYYGTRLWAKAEEHWRNEASKSGAGKPNEQTPANLNNLRNAIELVSEAAPQGRLSPLPTPTTPGALYTPHRPRFGRILKDREVEVLGAQIADSPADPFPGPQNRDEATSGQIKEAKEGWNRYLEGLKKAYGGQWENTGMEPAQIPPADWWKKK